jgi:hypothetical protein
MPVRIPSLLAVRTQVAPQAQLAPPAAVLGQEPTDLP